MTLTLDQGAQNSNGTWPITGTEVTDIAPGQVFDVSGTLDQYGDFALYLPVVWDNNNCIEWLLLGSGDVTSQGLAGAVACTPPTPPVPSQNFLQDNMDMAEGAYYQLGHPPLFKSQMDKPPIESPLPQGWWTGPGSTLPTYGQWERVLPTVNSFIGYAGRFVYEQSGGAATDGCWYSGSSYAYQAATLSGGGWLVDQSGDWGLDTMGFSSQFDSFYQDRYGPMAETCQITTPQTLYIDGRTGPVSYITDTQMPAEITPKDLLTGVAAGGAQMVTECEPYPGIRGKCK
jgi:hypothetical protein